MSAEEQAAYVLDTEPSWFNRQTGVLERAGWSDQSIRSAMTTFASQRYLFLYADRVTP